MQRTQAAFKTDSISMLMSAKLNKAKRSVSDFSYLPYLDPAFRQIRVNSKEKPLSSPHAACLRWF